MRNRVVFPFPLAWSQIHFFPVTSVQKPFVRGPRDITAVEKDGPDQVYKGCGGVSLDPERTR